MTNNSIEKDTLTKFVDGELDLATSFWGFLMVGSAATILLSSMMLKFSSNGRLKSTLIKTVFPFNETVSIVFILQK